MGILDLEHRIPEAFKKYDARTAEFFARQPSNSLKIFLDLVPIVDSIENLNAGSREIKCKVDTAAGITSKNMKGRIMEEIQFSPNGVIQNGERMGEPVVLQTTFSLQLRNVRDSLKRSRSLSEFMCIVEMFMRREDVEKKV